MIKTYYLLTKPGIIRGNSMTAAAGFFLASQHHINAQLLAAALIGTSLVIAAGCVFNNYIDRTIDKKMARTKQRALVLGIISRQQALTYATALAILGFVVLAVYTNWLTVAIGVAALFFYVVLYGIAKRRSVHGTIIGSVPGAASIVAGYTAVTGRLDGAALLLFLILVCWQMPHFYAIALYRFDDYAAAGLPVLPVKKGSIAAKKQILFYITVFTVAAASLSLFEYTGPAYLAVVLLLGLAWLSLGLKNYTVKDDKSWGHAMFLFSLLVIIVFCIALSLDSLL